MRVESLAIDLGTCVGWNLGSATASCATTRPPKPVVVASTTAIWRSPPAFLASSIWNPMMPTISRGPRIVPTQNHLVRTRSTNSRRRIAKTLRTGHLRARIRVRGIRADQVDEDLVQRRRHQLELGEPRPRGHQCFQNLLRVGRGGQLQL